MVCPALTSMGRISSPFRIKNIHFVAVAVPVEEKVIPLAAMIAVFQRFHDEPANVLRASVVLPDCLGPVMVMTGYLAKAAAAWLSRVLGIMYAK